MLLKILYHLGLTNLSDIEVKKFENLFLKKFPKESLEDKSYSKTKFLVPNVSTTNRGKITVIGVGGGGCNAIDSMIKKGLHGVEYVAIDSDIHALNNSDATHKIQVDSNITGGLDSSTDLSLGKKSIGQAMDKIANVLTGSDMVFVIAGMGGGIGSGGASIIAYLAKSIGSLVVGIVTKPFKWEGKTRMLNAGQGIHELKQYVDILIVIPNDRLLNIRAESTKTFAVFDTPNEVLYEATRGIADIITVEGLINVDFADVRAVINQKGEALIGCGFASGENRAIRAAKKAISSPLLGGVNIKSAKSLLINVTGSSNLTIQEVNEGNNVIFEAADEQANVIFGCVQNEEMKDYVSYTVIATDFDNSTKSFISRSSKGIRQTHKEPDVFVGKFSSRSESTETDSTDLEVPTIYRVKKPLLQLDIDNEDENVKNGFVFNSNKLNWSKDKPQKDIEKQKLINDKDKTQNDSDKQKKDEEDSSSFLRMIMD